MSSQLAETLSQRLGVGHVLRDEASRRLAGNDVASWTDTAIPELVLRPGSTAEVSAALMILAKSGSAVVPRGGGMSYTGGVVPTGPAVVLDLRRLDTIHVEARDRWVAVGAGVTWQALREALRPHGLRTAQPGPISGVVSTVGGAASQNMPGGLDGVIGLTVVLADGRVMRTGSGAQPGLSPFQRYHGPDLTGLFLGDCGAYGVKTEIVLRLVPEQPAAFASLGFSGARQVLDAMLRLIDAGFTGRAFAMDRARAESAGKLEMGEALRTAAAVAGGAGSFGAALKRVAGLARTRGELAENDWTLHLTAEGATASIAEALIESARERCGAGVPVAPAVPQALHAKPFSVRGMVGPQGERWVPVHGILPPSRAMACLAALQDCVAQRAAALDAAGIAVNWIMSSSGPQVTIEPMMYWRDALDPLHFEALGAKYRARFDGVPVNEAARSLVAETRGALRSIFAEHGAAHAQLGRYYAPLPSDGLAALLKRTLDPAGRMNPGVLGL